MSTRPYFAPCTVWASRVPVGEAGSASAWALIVMATAFTALLGLVVDGGNVIDARLNASRAAAQAARVGADALSQASLRNGHDSVDTAIATARARSYLHAAGMNGTTTVQGQTVSVTVRDRAKTQILGVLGISSFPVQETQTAVAITEAGAP